MMLFQLWCPSLYLDNICGLGCLCHVGTGVRRWLLEPDRPTVGVGRAPSTGAFDEDWLVLCLFRQLKISDLRQREERSDE